MRRPFVALSAGVGALALATACASSTGSLANGRFGATPSTPRQVSATERDSIYAQAIADREGPRVDVRAEISQMASSRHLRAAFHVEDDSYVLIGQVDASGTVRIVFPSEPHDDGFVRGGKSYETAEFFAGFTDQFRYRFTNFGRYYGARPDSYDGGLGYLFIVASWRPMRFDKFSTNDAWDSFELADEASLRDPKPAIYELASLLAGENREAYTVKFATYYNTRDYSSPYGYRNAYGYGLCSGYGYMGWNGYGFTSPFGSYSLVGYQSLLDYGYDFTYRGQRYLYNGAGDCYNAVPLYYGNPFSIASVPAVPTKPRLAAEDAHRTPGTPRLPIGHLGVIAAQDANPSTQVPRSPTYRDRGLLTDDDNSGAMPGRRGPRVEPQDHGITRPTIQQMVEHRVRDAVGDNNSPRPTFRGTPSDANNRGWASRANTPPNSYNPPRERAEPSYRTNGAFGSPSGGGSTSGYTGTRSAPADVSRSPSSSGSGGSIGGGASPSSSSSSGSTGTSGASSAGSAGSSSGGGSPIKPPKQ